MPENTDDQSLDVSGDAYIIEGDRRCSHPGVGTLIVAGSIGFGVYQSAKRGWTEYKLRKETKKNEDLAAVLHDLELKVAALEHEKE